MAGDIGATLDSEGWTVPGAAGDASTLTTSGDVGGILTAYGWETTGDAGTIDNLATNGGLGATLDGNGWTVPDIVGAARILDTNAAPNTISEAAQDNDVVEGLSLSAVGFDGTVTWSLLDDAGGAFQINSSTGAVSVASAAALVAGDDTITVQATDGVETETKVFTITVEAAALPVIGIGQVFSIDDNIEIGDAVGTVSATPGDVSIDSFAIVGGNTGTAFAIDSAGEITTLVALNAATIANYSLIVTATDIYGTSVPTAVGVALDAITTSISDSNAGENTVLESATNGTTVGVTASGTGFAGTIVWSLLDDADGVFTIDGGTGVVTVADYTGLLVGTETINIQGTDGTRTRTLSVDIEVAGITVPAFDFAQSALGAPGLTPGFTYSTGVYRAQVQQYDGSFVTPAQNEIAILGGRRVYNERKDDLSVEVIQGNTTLAGADVSLNSVNASYRYWYNATGTYPVGTRIFARMTIACAAGTRTIGIKLANSTSGPNAVSTVQTVGVSPVTVTFELTIATSAGLAWFGIDNRTIAVAGTDTAAGTFTVTDLFIQRARAGQTVIDPEHVTRGVESSPYHGFGIDGLKWFATDEYGVPNDAGWRVENLVPNSYDLSDSGFIGSASMALGADEWVTVAKTTGSAFESKILEFSQLPMVGAGVYVELLAGTSTASTIGIYTVPASNWGADVDVDIETVSGPAGYTRAGSQMQITGLDATTPTIFRIRRRGLSAKTTVRFYIYPGGNASTTSGDSNKIRRLMFMPFAEYPNEYLSTGELSAPFHGYGKDGVKWYEGAWQSTYPMQTYGFVSRPAITNLTYPSEGFAGRTHTVSNGGQYTLSFYGTGSIGYSGAATGTLSGTGANTRVSVTVTTTTTSLVLAAPSGTVTKVQLEYDSHVHDHVVTTVAAVTATEEMAKYDLATIGYSVGGTFVVEYLPSFDIASLANQRVMSVEADASNYVQLTRDSGGQQRLFAVNGGATQVDGVYSGYAALATNAVALRIKANDYNVIANGTIGTPDASATVPTIDTLCLGRSELAASTFAGAFKRIYYWVPDAIDDATADYITEGNLPLITDSGFSDGFDDGFG